MPSTLTPAAPATSAPHAFTLSLLTVAVFVAGLHASPAQGADAPDTPAIALEQITISATRQPQDVTSVPSTVSVQDRAQLDQQNVNSIRDLVRYEPGVSVGGAGQRAGTTGYNIRGIDGDRVLTQIDGVEIPSGFSNGPHAKAHRNYVDPEIVKRVEILRGPASVLHGSSAIGGAVSYFTLDPDDIIKPGEDVGARLKAGYSSADDSWLKSATVAGRLNDVDGLLHLSGRNGNETESYGNENGLGLDRTKANPEFVSTTNVLAKLGWNYSDDSRLGLTYEKYKDDRDTYQDSAVGGPFMDGKGQNMYLSRDGNDTITRERFGLEHRFSLDSVLADNVKWSLNHQNAKTEQSTHELYNVPSRGGQRPASHARSAGGQPPVGLAHGGSGQPPAANVRSGQPTIPHSRSAQTGTPPRLVYRDRDSRYEEKQWVFDAQLDKAFAIASTDHVLTYGTTIKQQKTTGLRSGSGTCAAALGSCQVIGADSPADRLKPSSDFPDPTVNTYSLFAQDQIRWNDWTFLPGLRYEYTRLDPRITQEFLNTVAADGKGQVSDKNKTWHRVTPKLGTTYAISDQYTWFGQYAEGFRTPTAKALYGRFENLGQGYVVEPNPNLKAERSKSYETGLRGNFESGSFDMAVFYNTYRDFINEDAIQPGYDQAKFTANNIKHATIKGAEVKGRLNLDSFGAPAGLYTQGSVAYAYGKNNDTGEPINSVNPLTGVFGLGYDQNSYGGLLSWTLVKRKDRVDSTNFKAPDGSSSQFKSPGYGVFDLSAYYKVTNDVTVNAGLYNLTDKKYWSWDDVRGYDSTGEAAATAPANLNRLTEPGRNFAVNVVWDI
ncbi:MAG: TonB-dependent receptor [Pseudomonas sp.]|nr:TonB-dependent receptor [Pseudomonas sp.]